MTCGIERTSVIDICQVNAQFPIGGRGCADLSGFSLFAQAENYRFLVTQLIVNPVAFIVNELHVVTMRAILFIKIDAKNLNVQLILRFAQSNLGFLSMWELSGSHSGLCWPRSVHTTVCLTWALSISICLCCCFIIIFFPSAHQVHY